MEVWLCVRPNVVGFMGYYFYYHFLTRELRACARASYRDDVGNSIRSLARSLDWSIPVNFF